MSKTNRPQFHMLVPAAGNGSRMGLETPKQYCKINGKTILRHTLEKLLSVDGIKSLRVIIDEAHRDLYNDASEGMNIAPPIIGAATRKQSVYNGLQALANEDQNDLVLIHDAARPFVDVDAIHALLDKLETHTAATLAVPIADTLVDTEYNTIDRDTARAIQTPQGFRLSTLRAAHDAHKDDERFTDDAGLVIASGHTVELVEGPRGNFKITTQEDYVMAQKLLSAEMETRTGMGFDVHAFDPAPATHVRLGGLDIPHSHKLAGHSDADVVLHTLTDALLGAINEGDIGQLFPPSDMQWKGADSEIFLKEAAKRVEQRGGKIIHADITIICEAPKIGPHCAAMKERVASIVGVTTSRISIKATTTEQLGFTGRREGIAAQAVATVQLPVQD